MDQILDEKTQVLQKEHFEKTVTVLIDNFTEEQRYDFLNNLKAFLESKNKEKIEKLMHDSEQLNARAKTLSSFQF